MIDKTKIINVAEKIKNPESQLVLKDGGVVIDTAVDELNRLHYVIKREKGFSVELAENTQPIEKIIKHANKFVTITDGVVESVEDRVDNLA